MKTIKEFLSKLGEDITFWIEAGWHLIIILILAGLILLIPVIAIGFFVKILMWIF